MKTLLFLLCPLLCGQSFGAPPSNCCCSVDGTCEFRKFCTRDGGVCDAADGCDCDAGGGGGGGGGVDDSTCTTVGNTLNDGPRVSMAWISDQFANWDEEWDMSKGCHEGNQFKCCHDWLVDPTSSSGINTVSLAFLKPTEILDNITDYRTTDGVRIGMPGAIDYFKDSGKLVIVSVGGVTYTDDWEIALSTDAEQLAINCATIATDYGVGIEIDYEESSSPLLAELETFIRKYRSIIPFDPSATPAPESILTLDFGQGAQFMGPIANWVAWNAFDPTSNRLLNWANAMVSGGQQSRVSDLIVRWNQHVNGYSTLQTYPIPPAYLVVSLWSSGRKAQANCVDYSASTLNDASLKDYIENVQPCIEQCGDCKAALPQGAQYTKGLLGYAFWMCGNIGPRQTNTCPLETTVTVYGNTYDGDGHCLDGFQGASIAYGTSDTSPNLRAY